MKYKLSLMIFVLMALAGAGSAAQPQAIQAPVLKWSEAGCYSSWCETGWYSSPAVADLDNDGRPEVIGGAYSLVILDGVSGALEQRLGDYSHRVWPGVVVADLDNDGDVEIVTAKSGGYLFVYDHQGNAVWTQQPVSNELRGLSVADLDADGTLEIIVTGAVYGKVNTWVYEHTGALRSGWPQLSNDSGYAYGIFNDNAAVGDLDGDGSAEIVVPSDVHYINAYEPDGTQIPANAMYGGKGWGKVGVWEDPAIELRGWGDCSSTRSERYRTNFAHGPAGIADMDGDGAAEVVAVGNVYDCKYGHPPGKYNGVYVFNADRSRFDAGGHDWSYPPVDTGAPLSEDYNVIESAQPNPVLADLDGDGELEILFASYDGKMHAFWLDKTEHGNWPYAVYTGGIYRFASEPVVADLDNDGRAEVIFTSWVQKGSNQTGSLYILDYQGNLIHAVSLPPAKGSPDWNGALPAPTLADIDGDADLEVVVNTAHSGLVAYDLPGTENARILWGTGRGNYQRTGTPPDLTGSLANSWVSVHPLLPGAGEVLSYTIRLENSGLAIPSAAVTSTLPAQVTYQGDAWASSGSVSASGGIITWAGDVPEDGAVTITYSAQVDSGLTQPTVLVNTVQISDGQGTVWERQAVAVANGFGIHLPLIFR